MKRISQRIPFLLALCLAALGASAQSGPTAIEAFAEAQNVVTARVKTIDGGHGKTTAIVEKVFKGDMKTGRELVLLRKNTTSLMVYFGTGAVGSKLLLYLPAPEADGTWYINNVNRWLPQHTLGLDMLYLDKLDRVRGKTRIAGRFWLPRYPGNFFGDDPEPPRRRVTISGNGRKVRVKADKDGLFEVYGLPPGTYRITPERIPGFKLYGTETGGYTRELKPGGEIEESISFTIDNSVRGVVLDDLGQPVVGVYVRMLREDGKWVMAGLGEDHDESKADGSFGFRDLPPGRYIIAVTNHAATPARPFGSFYYPFTKVREEAGVITLGPGDYLEGFVVNAPGRVEFSAVSGTLTDENDKPVAGQSVEFREGGDPPDGDYSWSPPFAGAVTDADGHFEIKVVKGKKGFVSAQKFVALENCVECEEITEVPQPNQKFGVTTRTEKIAIDAAADVRGLELKFPAPSCRKFGLSIITTFSCGN
jgi:hypothetical protein